MAYNPKEQAARLARLATHPLVIRFEAVGRRIVTMTKLTECALWHDGDICQRCKVAPSTVRVDDGNEYGWRYVCGECANVEYARYTRLDYAGR